jgi:hypothetical protein
LIEPFLPKLRPHQIEPAQRLYERLVAGQNAVDGSDAGIGKTYVATAVALALNRPTLAVVPDIAQSSWRRAAEHLGGSLSVISYDQLRTGRTPFGTWDNTPPKGFRNEVYFKCQSCQREVSMENFFPCYCHPAGFHCLEAKKKAWRYGNFNYADQIQLLIFDEAHRCSAIDSLNAGMLMAARRQGIPTLCLSATLADGPLKLNALGYVLGLHNGKNFYNWTRRYGCGKIPGLKGWHWLPGKVGQKDMMKRLHGEIFPARGVRVKRSEVPGFPTVTVTAELYDLEESGKIEALYEEMREPLERLKARSDRDIDGEMEVTKLLRIRQKLELLKVPLAIQLAQDSVEKGNSVGLFINFKETMAELRRRLRCDCFIDGSPEGMRFRDKNIEAFQANKERIILVNSEAGGIAVSLHDLHGGHPREGFVMPVYSAVTFTQLIGRFPRDGGKSHSSYKVLLAARTPEEKIFQNLSNKLQNLEALLEGAVQLTDADFIP